MLFIQAVEKSASTCTNVEFLRGAVRRKGRQGLCPLTKNFLCIIFGELTFSTG